MTYDERYTAWILLKENLDSPWAAIYASQILARMHRGEDPQLYKMAESYIATRSLSGRRPDRGARPASGHP